MNTAIQLVAGKTITSTENETAVSAGTLNGGGNWTPGSGALMVVTIPVTTIKLSAGTETYSFKCQDSPDGTTFTDRSVNRAAADDSNLIVDGGSGTISFLANIKNPAHVRLVATLGGTSPSITIGNVTLTPLLNWFVRGTIVNPAGGTIVVSPTDAASELGEAVGAGGGGSIQGMQYIKFTPITSDAMNQFTQGQLVIVALAKTG